MLDNLVAQLQSYRGIWRQQKFIELIDHRAEIPFNQKSRMDARKILIQRIADLRTLFMRGMRLTLLTISVSSAPSEMPRADCY